MRLIRGLTNLKAQQKGAHLTIGNFDGVHLGHQAMLNTLRASASGHPTMVMLFEPSPAEFFAPLSAPPRLHRFTEKFNAIADLKIDYALKLHFNRQLASLSANDFVQQILMQHLAIKHLLVGEDFRYGRGREGNINSLQQAAQHHGFTLAVFPPYCNDQLRISSSQIRQALHAGELELAAQMLGRPYSMSGRVVHGEKRGRLFGVPTANLLPRRNACSLSGVFLTRVHGIETRPLAAIAHLGKQPTVGGEREQLEVHILNYSGDLYGKHLRVEFIKKTRDVEHFRNVEDLVHTMNEDIRLAKKFFNLVD